MRNSVYKEYFCYIINITKYLSCLNDIILMQMFTCKHQSYAMPSKRVILPIIRASCLHNEQHAYLTSSKVMPPMLTTYQEQTCYKILIYVSVILYVIIFVAFSECKCTFILLIFTISNACCSLGGQTSLYGRHSIDFWLVCKSEYCTKILIY